MRWEDVREYLRARLELAHDEADSIGVVWSFPMEGGAPVTQSVRLSRVMGDGAEWLHLVAGIGERDSVSPAAALEHNAGLLVGALCFLGKYCVVRQLAPLATLDAEGLERVVELVPHEAARLRRSMSLAPARAPSFEHFAD